MPLPDIELALESFQNALTNGKITLTQCARDRELFQFIDKPNGDTRLTYVRLDGARVLAMTQAIPCDPYQGEPCFNVSWVVPVELRGGGRAVEVFKAALNEMSFGFHKAGMAVFWVEAIVDVDNKDSQRVAARAISPEAIESTDGVAGVPIYQYLRRVECGSEI